MESTSRSSLQVGIASSDEQIAACFPVLSQLRPQLLGKGFVDLVRRLQTRGYELVYAQVEGVVRGVAGFEEIESIARGRYLYVFDLVTDSESRSTGVGGALFDWLVALARERRCREICLDSAVHRFAAHRFYIRKGMHIASHHFLLELEP